MSSPCTYVSFYSAMGDPMTYAGGQKGARYSEGSDVRATSASEV